MFPTYADILTSHQDLADCVKGAGGIVFMQDKTQSIERHSIHVIPSESTSEMTAYTWELLMQLIGLHLTHHYNPSLQGYSDCTSASAQINTTISSHNDKLCTKNAACSCQQPAKWLMFKIYGKDSGHRDIQSGG
jgi:hypothetical protein